MNRPQNFANQGATQFALREMQRILNLPQFWLVLFIVIIVLTVSGPFNTLQELAFAPRLAYWAAIAVLTSLPSFTIAFMVNWIASRKGWPVIAPIMVASLLSAVPVSLIVWGISAFVTGNGDPTPAGLLDISIRCLPICIGITSMYTLLRDRSNKTDKPNVETLFLKRLNPETGRQIISLQAQDHYVEVVTMRGKQLVLVRLEAAIGELDGIDGMRVHRSWWVAKAGVKAIKRDSGKLVVATTDGRYVPVSRSNEKAVRAWL